MAELLTPRQRAALHEAAHATIAATQGLEVGVVLLDPPEVRVRPPMGWAMAEDDEPLNRFLPDNVNDPGQRSQIAPTARIALAGAVIEAACFGEFDPANADTEKAAELVLSLGLFMDEHGDRAGDYLDRLQRQTIAKLSENWDAVVEVAMALLERGTLSGAQVRAIIDKEKT